MKLNIQEYANWCESTWRVLDDRDTLFVCVSGFAGESGEIAEEILSGDHQSLHKEFGDFFYYWIRLHQTLGNPVIEIEVPDWVEGAQYAVSNLCLQFHKYVGRVCESLKKLVATGNRLPTFEPNMQKTLNIWALLAYSQGYSLDSIMAANRDKIESRMERGTLFGSGNDR